MTLIRIKLMDQEAFIQDSPLIASGGVMESYVKFDFSSEWNDFVKVAVFYNDRENVYNTNVDSSNQAVIPSEVLTQKGTLYIGVIGVKGNVTKTSQMVKYRVEMGALDGIKVVPPLPSIYQEYLNIAQRIFAKDTYTKTEVDDKLNVQNNLFKNEINIERKRIDSLATLPQGSTTGDAELIDGRIGQDGVTHKNIGTHIRSLFLNLYLVDGKVCIKQ